MDTDNKKIIKYLLKVLNYNEYKQYPDESNKEAMKGLFEIFESYIKKGELNDKYGYGQIANDLELKSSKSITIAIIPKWIESVLIDPREDCGTIHENFIPIAPFYIKTIINHENKLDLSSAEVIWATCLESPNKIDDVSFVSHEMKTKLDKDNNWETFLASVKKQYEERYAINWDADEIEDASGKSHNIKTLAKYQSTCYWVMRDDSVTGTKNSIIALLNRLVNHPNEISPLLNKMLGEESKRIYSQPELGKNVSEHCGQMKKKYPLADAQRHAIHCMSQLTYGNVLAVSGPPGTGKTTMLQSVVADLIVKHALKASKPPVILATSANNKAITNVIDAFKIEDNDNITDTLYTRWLTFKNTPLPLAAYLPSGKVKNKDVFFCTDENGGNDYQVLRDSWKNLKAYFVDMARKSHTIKGDDIASIKNNISKELQNTFDMLEKIEKSLEDIKEKNSVSGFIKGIFRRIKSIASKTMSERKIRELLIQEVNKLDENNYSNKKSNGYALYESERKEIQNDIDKQTKSSTQEKKESLSEFTDKMLDKSLRYKCFWLAIHYFEASWLETVEMNSNIKLSMQFREEIYREMSFVCPCFVATFFRTPRCFKKNYKANEGQGYLFDFIDLLIVDEAGQACTEIGLPAFSLAQKAIVVGDEKQIPPIYTIKTGTSMAYWEAEIGTKNKNIYSLIDCSSSSIMRIASTQSMFNRVWTDGDKLKGLFLDEHRRCYKDIIEYSNKLIYKGRLNALVKNPKEGESVLPVMAHFYVKHSSSERSSTGSRGSLDEATAIARWIKENEDTIYKENKGKELEEIVSVITPFTHQATLIKKEIKKIGCKIPVGTVHTFQGAESPIVIYSTVYGSDEEFNFINNNKELMNVAVSRAKKHFFLFCSKEIPKEYTSGNIKNTKGTQALDLLLEMTTTKLRENYSDL